MSDNRRRFLGTMGAAALAGGVLPLVAHAALPQTDHPAPISDRYDVAWADKITGRFRAVFDSPNMAEGSAIVRATAWCDQYKEIYGVDRAAMDPVLVLRADAIELVMDDTYWGRFPVGEEHKFKGRDTSWLTVNPISAQSRAGANETHRRNTLETFMKEGGIVLACSWAFGKVIQRASLPCFVRRKPAVISWPRAGGSHWRKAANRLTVLKGSSRQQLPYICRNQLNLTINERAVGSSPS